jgi:hypothetical protein
MIADNTMKGRRNNTARQDRMINFETDVQARNKVINLIT